MMQSNKAVWLLACLIFSVSCTPKKDEATPKVVNLAVWSNYVSQELLQEFEKTHGIKVQISHYSSNEELLAKLQAGASGYDVAVPSDYMVFAMSKLGLLNKLDLIKLTEFKNLDYTHKAFDPKNEYSVPYGLTFTVLGYHKDFYKGKLLGWKDLFTRPDLNGKFTLLDDAREVVAATQKSLGQSINDVTPAGLAAVKKALISIRPKVKSFTSETLTAVSSGETPVAHMYMSDCLQAKRNTQGKVECVLPVEGGTLTIDSLVIPKGAIHLSEAHQLIAFLLSAKANAATTQAIFVTPANRAARALLSPELQKEQGLFPSAEVVNRFEMMGDLGEGLSQIDRIWTELKVEN